MKRYYRLKINCLEKLRINGSFGKEKGWGWVCWKNK